MEFKQGGVYLANLNPKRKDTEPGKIRPVLVLQTDMLNEAGHPSTIVLPLTSNIKEGFRLLRYRVSKRGELQNDSDLLIDQVRAIDNTRFVGEPVASLGEEELVEVLSLVCNVIKRA